MNADHVLQLHSALIGWQPTNNGTNNGTAPAPAAKDWECCTASWYVDLRQTCILEQKRQYSIDAWCRI